MLTNSLSRTPCVRQLDNQTDPTAETRNKADSPSTSFKGSIKSLFRAAADKIETTHKAAMTRLENRALTAEIRATRKDMEAPLLPGTSATKSDHGVVGANHTQEAILLAVEKGEVEALKTLLSHPGSDPNAKDKSGNLLLHVAFDSGQCGCAEVLINDPRTDVNAENAIGFHPLLRMAASNMTRWQSVTEALLAREDLDVNKESPPGRTALSLASSVGNDKFVRMLLTREDINVNKGVPGPLCCAVECKNTRVVRALLTRSDINIRGDLALNSPILKAHAYKSTHPEIYHLLKKHLITQAENLTA